MMKNGDNLEKNIGKMVRIVKNGKFQSSKKGTR
jgi:hypothetical protein